MSGYTNAPEQEAHTPLAPSLRLPTTRVPTRILSNMLANQIPINPIFLSAGGGRGERDLTSVVTDYFDGHLEWVTNILLREQLEQAAAQGVADIQSAPEFPLQRTRNLSKRLISSCWLPFFLVSSTSILVAGMVIYFTIVSTRPGIQVGTALGSAGLIHVLRLSAYLLPVQDEQRHPRFTMPIVALYTWPLGMFTCLAAPDGNITTTDWALLVPFLCLSVISLEL